MTQIARSASLKPPQSDAAALPKPVWELGATVLLSGSTGKRDKAAAVSIPVVPWARDKPDYHVLFRGRQSGRFAPLAYRAERSQLLARSRRDGRVAEGSRLKNGITAR